MRFAVDGNVNRQPDERDDSRQQDYITNRQSFVTPPYQEKSSDESQDSRDGDQSRENTKRYTDW